MLGRYLVVSGSNNLQITKDAFQQLLGKEPKVAAIHAGLECGIIGEKVPGMDAVSYGPTITGAHSPDEQVIPKTVYLLCGLSEGVMLPVITTSSVFQGSESSRL